MESENKAEAMNQQINNINQNNNENNNKNNIFIKTKPLSSYKKPTLIGLMNIGYFGGNDFMNAVLQCFSATEELTNYFLDEKISSEKILNNNIVIEKRNVPQLSSEYFQLINKLWDKNNYKGNFAPRRFMKTVEELCLLFKLRQPDNSKDFIIFLLQQLHDELKNKNNFDKSEFINWLYDKNNAFNYFINNSLKHNSIISDIFFGIEEKTIICLNCKNNYTKKGKPFPIRYIYQTFNCLIFPLENVREMKTVNYNNDNLNNQINSVSLIDCFNFYQKSHYLTGESRLYCDICKQDCDSLFTIKICSCPNVLIIILDRGKFDIFNVNLNYTEYIDITQFVLLKNGKVTLKLFGVILYLYGGNRKHCMSYCKSPIDNKWYRYNDSIVNEVKNFQEFNQFGCPYILFFKKEKDN